MKSSDAPKLRPRQLVLAQCRALIADGTLPQGGIMPSEHELARRFGAKRATVHLAIKQLEAEGLLRAGGGGRREVASGRRPPAMSCMHDTVAILTQHTDNSGFSEERIQGYTVQVQFGLAEAVRRSGRHALMLDPEMLTGERLERFLATPPMGLITTPCMGRPEERLVLLGRLRDSGVAVVADEEGPTFAGFDRVVPDHAAGTAMLVDLLAARGRKRILRWWHRELGKPRAEWLAERDAGYDRAVAAAGLVALPPLEFGGPSQQNLEDPEEFEIQVRHAMGFLCEHLVGPHPIDAIVLITDAYLAQVSVACRRLGREPGRDIDLVGYDNYWRQAHQHRFCADAPLATVDKDNFGIGQTLVAMLDERLAGRLPPGPQRRLMPPRLIRYDTAAS